MRVVTKLLFKLARLLPATTFPNKWAREDAPDVYICCMIYRQPSSSSVSIDHFFRLAIKAHFSILRTISG